MNLCPKCRSDWCSCDSSYEEVSNMRNEHKIEIERLRDKILQLQTEKSPTKSPLSRGEKLNIISSVASGIGDKALFCEDVLRERIKTCLKIAEELL